MSMGPQYQCHVCDGYLEGGTERSRCKCEPDPVIRCSRCGITVFASSNNTTGMCTGCARITNRSEPK